MRAINLGYKFSGIDKNGVISRKLNGSYCSIQFPEESCDSFKLYIADKSIFAWFIWSVLINPLSDVFCEPGKQSQISSYWCYFDNKHDGQNETTVYENCNCHSEQNIEKVRCPGFDNVLYWNIFRSKINIKDRNRL